MGSPPKKEKNSFQHFFWLCLSAEQRITGSSECLEYNVENELYEWSAVKALAVRNKMASMVSKEARGDDPTATPKISKLSQKVSGLYRFVSGHNFAFIQHIIFLKDLKRLIKSFDFIRTCLYYFDHLKNMLRYLRYRSWNKKKSWKDGEKRTCAQSVSWISL